MRVRVIVPVVPDRFFVAFLAIDLDVFVEARVVHRATASVCVVVCACVIYIYIDIYIYR